MMNKNIKTAFIYTCTAVFAFIFDRIYAIFSHGVNSASMSLVWLWLLCSGTVFYLILEFICGKIKKSVMNRLSKNIYNSGVAVFVTGMLLQGIIEIAGIDSELLLFYKIAGGALMLIGFVLILYRIFRR